MKKNITINLFGTLYAIDEDACQLLEQYTETMRSYFSKQEGGDEIIDDIEHRIAELLWENKEQGNEAVDIETIKNIINKIGNPEQMGEEKVQSNNQEQTESNAPKTEPAPNASQEQPRKFFRNGNDKMLGGVLSGLAQYFGGKDPLPWRIGFMVLAIVCFLVFRPFHGIQFMMSGFNPFDPFSEGGFIAHTFNFTNLIFSLIRWAPIIAYIVLWAIIPEAKTVEDRLKMQGKKVDSDSIKQEVINEHEQSLAPKQNQGCAHGCLNIFVVIAKIIGIGCSGCLVLFVISILSILLLGKCTTDFISNAEWNISGLPGEILKHTTLTSCGAPDITRDYDFSDNHFNEIKLKGVGTVVYQQGDDYTVRVDGDSCRISRLALTCDNGELRIETISDDENYNRQIHGSVFYYVTCPEIEKIRIEGVGELQINENIQQSSNFTLEMAGVGSADISYINCPNIDLINTGVGTISATVETNTLNVRNTGVGEINIGGHTKQYNLQAVSQFTASVNRDDLVVDNE